MDINDFCFSPSSFFQDVPQEDELPLDFEIPGPIPDLVDLYTINFQTKNNNNNNNNNTRVSLPEDVSEDLHVKKVETHNKNPSPNPRVSNGRMEKSPCQKLKTCSNDDDNKDKARVSKKNKKTSDNNNKDKKPRVCKKITKANNEKPEKIYSNNNNNKPCVSERNLIKTRETRSEEKLNFMPFFIPRERRSNATKTRGRIMGKKNP